jgi:hypothetical protein
MNSFVALNIYYEFSIIEKSFYKIKNKSIKKKLNEHNLSYNSKKLIFKIIMIFFSFYYLNLINYFLKYVKLLAAIDDH